jgi:hypothetical protein
MVAVALLGVAFKPMPLGLGHGSEAVEDGWVCGHAPFDVARGSLRAGSVLLSPDVLLRRRKGDRELWQTKT